MVDVAQRLATRTARPPTPPKEHLEQSTETSSPSGYFAHITTRIQLDTPSESPSSSAEYFARSSEKGTKKVGFSPWPKYHKPVNAAVDSPASEGELRPLPPSRSCKSSKSILKPSTDISTSSPMGELKAFDHSNFPRMIPSILAHLRSSSRISRLDAYSALLSSLSAYDDLPDTNIVVENLQEFAEYIRRDVAAKSGQSETIDTQLATQSLKLLTIFLGTPLIAESLPDDFRDYILDKCISSLENTELPKIAISHYMQVLAKQSFSGKHMTSERATRILSFMKDIVERVKGNSIVGLRFRIYGRLLIQSRHALASNGIEWIDHLVSGMLSTTKEIRSLAIAFGIDAGIAMGTTSSVSQSCFEMFSRKSSEGQTVVDFLAKRLNTMISSKEDTLHVPQIWSVLILLLRNRRHQLERWPHMKPWLMVIQKCLNSSDPSVKSLAMTAWNRLVLVINLDSSTSSHMIKMLRQPVVSHLNRKGGDKLSKQTRQLAHSSYCNLLYYAFRPSATHDQFDLYWEQYVDQILPESFSVSNRDTNQACGIIAALLYASQPKPWDENRANTARFIKPDELPCIDPKWTRSQASKVVGIFEKLVDVADWSCPEKGEPLIMLAWKNFTAALGDASKQEVKASFQIMSAVAQILNMLAKFWDRSYVQRKAATSAEFSIALRKLRSMIEAGIANIGAITFNEQRLLWSSSNHFEVAGTPSSRASKHQGTLSSPTVHLLRLLVSTIKNGEPTETYVDTLRYLLDVAVGSTTSRATQLAMLRSLTALVASDITQHTNVTAQLWQLIAMATEEAIKKPRSKENVTENSQYAGRDFRDAAIILEVGINHQTPVTCKVWNNLQSVMCESLRREVGDGGVTIMVTEPVSIVVNKKLDGGLDNFLLECATSQIRNKVWSHRGQDVDRAKRLLWGHGATNQKCAALDPSDQFCTMVDRVIAMAYENCTQLNRGLIGALLEALTTGLSTCPHEVKLGVVSRVQSGIALWIEDAHGILYSSGYSNDLVRVHDAVRRLWTVTIPAIEQMAYNNDSLKLLQVLMTSSLGSRHRVIVNDAISLWNRTFGTADQLDYPDTLRMILVRLRSMTDIELPTFPEVENADLISAPFQFIESQVSEAPRHDPLTPSPLKAPAVTTMARKISTGDRRSLRSPSLEPSPSVQHSRITKQRVTRTPQKARLKHDDSQVQFAAIVSSSPLAPEDMVSRILTDHQEEIRERQRHESAMFPALSSSPQYTSPRPDRDLPRLVLSDSKHLHQVDVDLDAQISPTSPAINGAMESYLGSSPTPRSSKKGNMTSEAMYGQSSPPIPTVAQLVGQKPIAPSPVDEVKATETKELEDETLRQSRILDPIRDLGCTDHTDRPTSTENQRGNIGAAINPVAPASSDVDIFVDASAEAPNHDVPINTIIMQAETKSPPITSPATAKRGDCRLTNQGCRNSEADPTSADIFQVDDDATSLVTDSFQSQSSIYSNDDEQVAAQLAADMERASSQAELAEFSKKRKRTGRDPAKGNKKARRPSRAQDCHVLVESQRPQDLDEDCVIVDTRIAIDSPNQQSVPVKRERSTSPTTMGLSMEIQDTGNSTTSLLKKTSKDGYLHQRTSIGRQAESHGGSKRKSSAAKETQIAPSQRTSKRRSARLNELTGNASSSRSSLSAEASSSEDKQESSSPATQIPYVGMTQSDVDGMRPHIETSADRIHAPTRGGQNVVRAAADNNKARPKEFPLEAIEPMRRSRSRNSSEGRQLHPDQGTEEQGQANEKDETNQAASGKSKTASPSLLEGFKKLLEEVKLVKLGAEEERAMVGVLFECVKEVAEAGRRHTS